ncbi:MAG: DUF4062 domain-containing protein [Mycobacteriaceae bacterium]
MADPRYQVFVSSTYRDLIAERQAVMTALLELGAMPAGMELFPASDSDAWDLIKGVIDESDYYLLVVGGRYGSLSEEGVSFTEMEYDYALSQAKPVLAFIHGEPGSIVADKVELSESLQAKLAAFISKVEKAKHVKFWTSPDDLQAQIAKSWHRFVKTFPAVGWVRGDAGDSPETIKALADAQRTIAELQATASASALTPPPGTEGLASGTDTYALFCEVQITYREPSSPTSYKRLWTQVEVSWDALFAELGPLMVNESDEKALFERQGEALYRLGYDFVQTEVKDWLKANATDGTTYSVSDTSAETTEAETVLLQLEALGLITQSERRRAVADKGTYWTLTPWGRHRLTQLRAIRKAD